MNLIRPLCTWQEFRYLQLIICGTRCVLIWDDRTYLSLHEVGHESSLGANLDYPGEFVLYAVIESESSLLQIPETEQPTPGKMLWRKKSDALV